MYKFKLRRINSDGSCSWDRIKLTPKEIEERKRKAKGKL
jgi:hypothetical protein